MALGRREFLIGAAALATTSACASDDATTQAGAVSNSLIAGVNPIPTNPPISRSLESTPFVLTIIIDDLNDYVGFLGGHPDAVTPNLNGLAAESVSFTQAYCSAPACGSSRPAMLFGLDPTVTGVYSNDDWRWWQSPALASTPSIVSRVKAAGYRTVGAGKVFHTPRREDGGADKDAFDRSEFLFDAPLAGSPLSTTELGGWGAFGAQGSDDDQPDTAHTTIATEELLEAAGPTAVFLGLLKPHLPFVVPQRYFDLYDAGQLRLPDYAREVDPDAFSTSDFEDVPFAAKRAAEHARQGLLRRVIENDEWRPLVHSYLAAVSFADAQVGRILNDLADAGRLDETTVLLTSDHGYQLGEKLTLTKFTLWESGTRVPLLLRQPGLAAGATATPASLLDVTPTLAKVAGAASIESDQPDNLATVAGTPDRTVLSSYRFRDDRGDVLSVAVRSRRHRLIRHNRRQYEFYDLAVDPLELNNLADDDGAALGEHRAEFDRLAALAPFETATPIGD